ncbi:MAG: YdcF family protein [Tistlia sp.]|uniref:YdcF family protein n=1 Tax=Tistlia sp. TaxID=3057121 RepID=UPI0034A289EE
MLFWVNKLVWWLVNAETLLLLALGLGGLLAWRGGGRWRRLGNRLLAGGVVFALAVAVLPLDQWILAPLERRFPPPDPHPARVDGVVALGGGISVGRSRQSGRGELNEAGDRILGMLELAYRHPEATVVYSSGAGGSYDPDRTEADYAGALAEAAGLAPGRVLLETRSRNTRENALESLRLAQPQPGERWLLVTSARHMPRAVASFRAAGWEVEAYPVDFEASAAGAPLLLDFAGRLRRLNGGLKEWLGLLGYRLLGWTDSLFPAPRPPVQ